MCKFRFKEKRLLGFSLIECLLALSIFAFCFTSLSGLLLFSLRSGLSCNQESVSILIARQSLLLRRQYPQTVNSEWVLPPINLSGALVENTEYVDQWGNRIAESDADYIYSYKIQMPFEKWMAARIFIRVEPNPKRKKREYPADVFSRIFYE